MSLSRLELISSQVSLQELEASLTSLPPSLSMEWPVLVVDSPFPIDVKKHEKDVLGLESYKSWNYHATDHPGNRKKPLMCQYLYQGRNVVIFPLRIPF